MNHWPVIPTSWKLKAGPAKISILFQRSIKKIISARIFPWFCATAVSETRSKCDQGDSVLTALEVCAMNRSFMCFSSALKAETSSMLASFENAPCSLTRCGSYPQTHVLTSSLNTAASWFPQIALHAVLHYSLMSSSTCVISSFFSHLSWKISRRDAALRRDQNAALQPISVHHLSSF